MKYGSSNQLMKTGVFKAIFVVLIIIAIELLTELILRVYGL